ncbi:MAG: DUF362 domain-containing protein [Thermodesulfobacteriota bacterium]|jgi:uncharacterized protein (DUF362 family)/Pyruvate/2-oxoacid:ferredoxin oxidoreductase delta subunit
MPKKTRVAIVKPSEHPNLLAAVSEVFRLIQADQLIRQEDRILLKPNLLLNRKNACTENDFIQAVILVFKKFNQKLSIGDSPGQFRVKGKNILKSIGIEPFLEGENVAYVEFEGGSAVKVQNSEAKLMNEYYMAQPVLEADIIVNLPRPKSHGEAAYTGAVKNYWGIIPGGEKALSHLYGKNPEAFGNVLVDNFQTLDQKKKRRITLMDARWIMEGLGGPAAGTMRETDLILGGTDEVAVDVVMLEIGGCDAVNDVPHLKACQERKLGICDLKQIEIVGKAIEEVRLEKPFKITKPGISRVLSFVSSHFFYKIIRKMPILEKKECIKCGDCFNICPAGAIEWQAKQYPVFIRERCISCLCCSECCTQQTIGIKSAGLRGLTWGDPEVVIK